MMKEWNSQKRFSLRKLKFGLASVAVALTFAVAPLASAEEAGAASAEEKTEVVADSSAKKASEAAPAEATPAAAEVEAEVTPIVAANIEIAEKATVAVVLEEEAKAGDVIDVKVEESEEEIKEVENADGSATAIGTKTTTVTTTSIPEETDLEGTSDTVQTVSEAEYKDEDEEATYDIYEKVTKTTTTEIVRKEEVVRTEEVAKAADVVFVIDRSASMATYIANVKNNLTSFVNNLVTNGVVGRFGLATFSDATIDRENEQATYLAFGDSFFTTDVDEIIAALEGLSLAIGGDIPETPTPSLAYIAENYDWNDTDEGGRFAILVTDATFKEDEAAGIPTMESVIAALNAKNISTTVIGRNLNEEEYASLVTATEGKFVDIYSDYSETLTKDVSTWIIDMVVSSDLYKVVTDKYEFYVAVTATPKVTEAAKPADPAKPTPTKHVAAVKKTAAPVKADELPKTGDSSQASIIVAGLAASILGVLGLAVGKKRKNN